MKSSRDVDGGWAWFVLGASYFNILLCSGLAFIAGVFQVVFLDHFNGSVALTSWVTSLFSSLMQLGGPLSSVVANRCSCRTSVLVGGCLMTTGLVISGMADGLGLLFVSFGVIAGSGLGLIYTSSVVVISYFFDKKRPLVNGLVSSAGGLGIFLAPQLSQVLLDHFTWRESLFVLAGVSAHVCVAGALMFTVHEKMNGCKNPFRQRYQVREEFEVEIEEQNLMLVSDDCVSHGDKAKVKIENVANGDKVSTCLNGEYDYAHTSDSQRLELQCNKDNISKQISNDLDCEVIHDCVEIESDCFAVDKQCSSRSSSLDRLIKDSNHQKVVGNSGNDRELSSSNRDAKTTSSSFCFHQGDGLQSSEDDKEHLVSERLLEHSNSNRDIISKDLTSSSNIRSSSPNDVIVVNNGHENLHKNGQSSSENFPEQNGTTDSGNSEIAEDKDDGQSVSTEYPQLFRNKFFWVLCLSLFISNAGCGIFNIHVPSFLKGQGLSEQEMTHVLSVNGIAILFGRSLIGALSNSLPGSDLLLFMSLHIVGGFFVCLMPILGTTFVANLLIIFGIGSYAGSLYALLPTLTIHYVGLNSLATAFGLEMVSAGLGYLVSPPLAGIIVDLTHVYTYNILIGGLLFIVGGIVLMVLPCMESRWQRK